MTPSIQTSLFGDATTRDRVDDSRADILAVVLDREEWLHFIADEWWPLTAQPVRMWRGRAPRVSPHGSNGGSIVAWIDPQRLAEGQLAASEGGAWRRQPLTAMARDAEVLYLAPLPLAAVTRFSLPTEHSRREWLATARLFANVGVPAQRIDIEDLPVAEALSETPTTMVALSPPRGWSACRAAAAMAVWANPGMEVWTRTLCEALTLHEPRMTAAELEVPWWADPPWLPEAPGDAAEHLPLWRAVVDTMFEHEDVSGWRPRDVLDAIVQRALERGAERASLDDLHRETLAILRDERSVSVVRGTSDPLGLAVQLLLLRPDPDRFVEWRRDLDSLPPGVWWTGAVLCAGFFGYQKLPHRFRGAPSLRLRLAQRTWQALSGVARSPWPQWQAAPTVRRADGIIHVLWDTVECAERQESPRGRWLRADLSRQPTRQEAIELAKQRAPGCLRRSLVLRDVEVQVSGPGVISMAEDVLRFAGSVRLQIPSGVELVTDLDDAAFRRWLQVEGIEGSLTAPTGLQAYAPLPKKSVGRVAESVVEIPGLLLLPEFVTADEERELLHAIDESAWSTELSRRVQHYGWRYRYRERSLTLADRLGPLPPWAAELAHRLVTHGVVTEVPDQVIVNEYVGKQGISKHTDCLACFRGPIEMVSLGEPWDMNFYPPRGAKISQRLERRSLAVLDGPVRETWKHEIPARKSESWGPRGRRVSLTFRRANPQDATKPRRVRSTPVRPSAS